MLFFALIAALFAFSGEAGWKASVAKKTSRIFKQMAIDAALNSLPPVTQFMYDSNCRKTCASDNCKGTMTNPVPWGEQWEVVSQDGGSGCCSFWGGECNVCRKPGTLCEANTGRRAVEEAAGGSVTPAIALGAAAGVAMIAAGTYHAAKKCKQVDRADYTIVEA